MASGGCQCSKRPPPSPSQLSGIGNSSRNRGYLNSGNLEVDDGKNIPTITIDAEDEDDEAGDDKDEADDEDNEERERADD